MQASPVELWRISLSCSFEQNTTLIVPTAEDTTYSKQNFAAANNNDRAISILSDEQSIIKYPAQGDKA